METKNKNWIVPGLIACVVSIIGCLLVIRLAFGIPEPGNFGGLLLFLYIYPFLYIIISAIFLTLFSKWFKTIYTAKVYITTFFVLSWVIPVVLYLFTLLLAPIIQYIRIIFSIIIK